MFENITKGVWSIDKRNVKVNKHGSMVYPLRVKDGVLTKKNVVKCYSIDADKSNAEFIAYCFNLQQRFDISKLEESVKMLEKVFNMCDMLRFPTEGELKHTKIKTHELLTQIKK